MRLCLKSPSTDIVSPRRQCTEETCFTAEQESSHEAVKACDEVVHIPLGPPQPGEFAKGTTEIIERRRS
jgi:hypothetical protein